MNRANLITLLVISALFTAAFFIYHSTNYKLSQLLRSFETQVKTNLTSDVVYDSDQLKRNEIFAAQLVERQKYNRGLPVFFELIESIMPQINCPGAVRFGAIGDGGKWLCRPWRHSPNCTVYSLGVGGNPTFEQEVVKFTNCSTYSFDPNKGYANLFNSDRMHFRPWGITKKSRWENNATDRSVADVMKLLNHSKLEVLKVDIEGGEYDIMPTIFEHSVNVQICQILTEVHGRTVQTWKDLLAAYERADYFIFSIEPNWGCGATPCVEYAHIHKSCLAQYGLESIKIFKNFGSNVTKLP